MTDRVPTPPTPTAATAVSDARRSPHSPILRGLGAAAALVSLTAVAGCGSGGTVYVTTTVTPAVSTLATPGTDTAGGAAALGSTSITEPENTAPDATASSPETSTPTTTSSSTPTNAPVHVSTFEGDGETFGVGMAVIALFSAPPTDPTAFEKAATVTVDGQPADGAWYWQDSIVPGYATEALYREKDYWPAKSTIDVDLPVQGLSAGTGLVYDDSLTVEFEIGDAHISHVDNAQHMMTVTSNDSVVKNLPISLGSATTPTYDGVKVVMGKGSVDPKTGKPRPDGTVEMKSDPGESPSYDLMVPWSVRVTNSGEFVHSASWNGGNIGSRNTSHGCTNLNVGDAEWFYDFSLLGDVVEYPDANAAGTVQPPWDGWGWWNVPWDVWQQGGKLAGA